MSAQGDRIEIYPQNNKIVNCVISGIDATGFTPYLTVKKKTLDTSIYLSKIGTVTDPSIVSFNLTASDTSMNYGDYVYSIELEKDTTIYTVVKDRFIIIDGVKY